MATSREDPEYKKFEEDLWIKYNQSKVEFDDSKLICSIGFIPSVKETNSIRLKKSKARDAFKSLRLRLIRDRRKLNDLIDMDLFSGHPICEDKQTQADDTKLTLELSDNIFKISSLTKEIQTLNEVITSKDNLITNMIGNQEKYNNEKEKDEILQQYGSRAVNKNKELYKSIRERSTKRCVPYLKEKFTIPDTSQGHEAMSLIMKHLSLSMFDEMNLVESDVENSHKFVHMLWSVVCLSAVGLTTLAEKISRSFINDANQVYYHELSIISEMCRSKLRSTDFIS